MNIVKVKWLDICSGTANWSHIEDIEPKALECVSVGFLLEKTDDIVCIAQNYATEEGLVSDTMTFPLSIVKDIIVLEEKK